MNWNRLRLRAPAVLPALLLALFIGAQFELAGHLHADGTAFTDCYQCQSLSGQATLSSGGEIEFYPHAGLNLTPAPVATPFVVSYRLQARGPPLLS